MNTAAPVDVISAAELTRFRGDRSQPVTLGKLALLQFPRPGLADGTDTIRPGDLSRGLAPDQTLVLVKFQASPSASLVNINGTIGRGSSAVDLNTIPSAMVQSIEVLRDGASAQYGSDAIAGVINLRLKDANSGGGITATYGARVTTVNTWSMLCQQVANWTVADKAKYDRTDGQTANLSGWLGLPIGQDGFVTLAAEYLNQEKTVRTAPDWRQQYDKIGAAFDPREATFNRYDAWYGEPEIEQYTLFANAGYDVSDTVKLYGLGQLPR